MLLTAGYNIHSDLHFSLQVLDGDLSSAQPPLSFAIPLICIVVPLQLIGVELQLALLAVTHRPLCF